MVLWFLCWKWWVLLLVYWVFSGIVVLLCDVPGKAMGPIIYIWTPSACGGVEVWNTGKYTLVEP